MNYFVDDGVHDHQSVVWGVAHSRTGLALFARIPCRTTFVKGRSFISAPEAPVFYRWGHILALSCRLYSPQGPLLLKLNASRSSGRLASLPLPGGWVLLELTFAWQSCDKTTAQSKYKTIKMTWQCACSSLLVTMPHTHRLCTVHAPALYTQQPLFDVI